MTAILCRNVLEIQQAQATFNSNRPVINIGMQTKSTDKFHEFHLGHEHLISESKKLYPTGIIQVTLCTFDYIYYVKNKELKNTVVDINYIYNWLDSKGVDIVFILDYNGEEDYIINYGNLNDAKLYAENIITTEKYDSILENNIMLMGYLEYNIMTNKVLGENNLYKINYKIASDKDNTYTRVQKHFYDKYITPVYGTKFHLIPALKDEYGMPYSASYKYLNWSPEDLEKIRNSVLLINNLSPDFSKITKTEFINNTKSISLDDRKDKRVFIKTVDIFDDVNIFENKTLIRYGISYGEKGHGTVFLIKENLF